MFVNATAKQPKQVNASTCKDVQWSTYSLLHGFASQGIWPNKDYTDVNSVDRSHDGTTLATGDDFGKVKLFKYPCTVTNAESNSYVGHSSHVTKVKFTANDTLIISTGGGDKTVMVWDTSLNNDSEFDR
jgi:WD40 repeat protein